jgi:hypothetical protein
VTRPVSTKTAIYIGFSLLCGIGASVYGQPLIHDNERALNVIVTVFSILAGFLVAIMTIIGDPIAFGRNRWRAHELLRSNVYQRLVRQKWLFFLYLVTLGTIFADTLVSRVAPRVGIWLEYAYLGLATSAFILSLSLPATLMKIQLDRHDEMIEQRRTKSSGSDN